MTKLVESVARAVWEMRRDLAKSRHGVELEEWGDGTVPKANHIMEEAACATLAVTAHFIEAAEAAEFKSDAHALWVAVAELREALDGFNQISANQAASKFAPASFD